jgi:hypothetical protein
MWGRILYEIRPFRLTRPCMRYRYSLAQLLTDVAAAPLKGLDIEIEILDGSAPVGG